MQCDTSITHQNSQRQRAVVFIFSISWTQGSPGVVLLRAPGCLHLSQACGLGSDLLHVFVLLGPETTWETPAWQMHDRCTRAQPNHAADLRSPLASHLLTFPCQSKRRGQGSGTGQGILLTMGGERKGREGKGYSSGNTPVCPEAFVVPGSCKRRRELIPGSGSVSLRR